MKKNLRYILASTLLLFCGTAFAEEVTISAADMQAAATEATTVNGITFEAAKNGGSTAPTFNANGQDFRIYAKGSLKVSAGQNITKMVFNISAQGKKRLAPITASVGSIAEQALGDETVTWTGEATEIELTVGDKAVYGSDGDSKAGQFDFESVVITIGEGGQVQTKAAKPVISPNGGTFSDTQEVTISAADGAKIYYALNDAAFGEYTAPFTLTETTTVKAYAIDETKDVKQSETVEATFTKITIQKITVAEALAIIDGLADGAKTEQEYDVEGFVVGTPDFQRNASGALYGNVNFDMADQANGSPLLTVFRAKNIGNVNFTEETINSPKEGDKVVVHGQLQKFVKNGEITPEIAQGCYLVSVESVGPTTAAKPVISPNGGSFVDQQEVTISAAAGAKIYYALNQGAFQLYNEPFILTETTLVEAYAVDETCDVKQSETVEATFTKVSIEKITVAQALAIIDGLEDGAKTSEEYDIEGYIVYIKEVSPKVGDQGYGNATYDINDEAGVTENALTVFRGYYLNNEYFTAEDQINVGEKVVVRGKLQRYVKNGEMTPEVAQYNYIVTKGESTGITETNKEAQSQKIYNLSGQRVNTVSKGLYIINGKKVIR